MNAISLQQTHDKLQLNTSKSSKQANGAKRIWQGHNVVTNAKQNSLVDRIIAFFKQAFGKLRSFFKRNDVAVNATTPASRVADIHPVSNGKQEGDFKPFHQTDTSISFNALWKDSKAPINLKQWDGTYPLHAAIRLGQNERATSLLEKGANPSLMDFQGLTAYDYALLSKNTEMLQYFFPKKSIDGGQAPPEQPHIATQANQSHLYDAMKFKCKLEALIKERSNISKEKFSKLYQILLAGDIETFKVISHGELAESEHHITPLHCALLSKNENMAKIIIESSEPRTLLAQDDKGLTPLHYAAMLGLSESLELLLGRVKIDDGFNVNTVDATLNCSVVNLAIAAGHPKILALLCHHGADLNYAPSGILSPANLLTAHLQLIDPLNITTGQYLLAAFSLLSFATDMISPEATFGLFICSMMANAALYAKGGFQEQLLYWSGEGLSCVIGMGLVRMPLIKAAIDIARIANVCIPCIRNIGCSLYNLRYETNKAIKCATVNTIIAGSTGYRLKGSVQYIQESINTLSDLVYNIFTFNVRKRNELVGFHDKLVIKENGLNDFERELLEFNAQLLGIISDIHTYDKNLLGHWMYLNKKEKSLMEREQLLSKAELEMIINEKKNENLFLGKLHSVFEIQRNKEVIPRENSPLVNALEYVKNEMAGRSWTLPDWKYEEEVTH